MEKMKKLTSWLFGSLNYWSFRFTGQPEPNPDDENDDVLIDRDYFINKCIEKSVKKKREALQGCTIGDRVSGTWHYCLDSINPLGIFVDILSGEELEEETREKYIIEARDRRLERQKEREQERHRAYYESRKSFGHPTGW